MLRAKTVLFTMVLGATACAANQSTDTAPPTDASAEPTAPPVDPAILEANEKDIEELGALLPEFQKAAEAATAGPSEAQSAAKAVSDLGEEKGVKKANVDKIVASSLKKGKVKLRGVKKADREEMTAAVQTMLDKIEGLKTAPKAIADARAEVERLKARAEELAQAVRERTEEVAAGPDAEGKDKAQAQIDHVAKVLEAVQGNVSAAGGVLDDLEKNSKALAEALGVTFEGEDALEKK